MFPPEVLTSKSSVDRNGNYRYLNLYCTEICINNILDGKLQCTCGETGRYNWVWLKEPETSAILADDCREVTFHPVYSSGTAALRGSQCLTKNLHHYWEMKMLSNLYGTDIMVGVGTAALIFNDWRYEFVSLLGYDRSSWGYSYGGKKQYNSIKSNYATKFGLGSLIGVHVDMYAGTLEYYYNRRPLGVAFRDLKNTELYPMISSTAAQSAMKLTCATSFELSLEFTCLKAIVKNPHLYHLLKDIPGLMKVYEHKFFWLFCKDLEDSKRKPRKTRACSKRRKLFNLNLYPTSSLDANSNDHNCDNNGEGSNNY